MTRMRNHAPPAARTLPLLSVKQVARVKMAEREQLQKRKKLF